MFDRGHQPPTFLDGVKVARGPIARLSKLFCPGAIASGRVEYRVDGESPLRQATNRRREARREVRLQSGKIVDERDQYVVDCLFRDRGDNGCQIRLCKHVRLPIRIRVYDDQRRSVSLVRVVWRRGLDLGCRLIGPKTMASERMIKRLEGRYYATR